MSTVQDIIDSASLLAQDAGHDRVTLGELTDFFNDAIREAHKLRPDLFFGTYNTTLSTYALTDVVPLPPDYEPYLIDYLVMRIESVDSEFGDNSRAVAFQTRFREGLQGL